MNSNQLKKFIGRKNVFAVQLDDGSYIPIKRNITENDLVTHLSGEKTYGTYVIDENGLVTYGVIDIDGDKKCLQQILIFSKFVVSLFPEFDRILEFSGRRGYHVWIFFNKPEKPAFVRELIKTRLKKVGILNIEIFPKQNSVSGKGYGNLIKLPCGKHRLGDWSKIINNINLKVE